LKLFFKLDSFVNIEGQSLPPLLDCFLFVFKLDGSEVNKLQVIILVQQKIRRLQVSVSHPFLMNVFQHVDYLCNIELGKAIPELAYQKRSAIEFVITFSLKESVELSICSKVHYEVKISFVLVRVMS
jgi:hypothetical protein